MTIVVMLALHLRCHIYPPHAENMAPTIVTLSPPRQAETNLAGEKKIWAIVIPLSICIPCLIACILYVFRRRRQKLAKQQQPTSDGDVPIEVHQQAWLEHMRNMTEQNQRSLCIEEDVNQSVAYPASHDTTRHTRSQSTPPMFQTNCRPQRCDSPLRREWHQGICDKEVFEFPPPQGLPPAARRESS